MSSTTEPDNKFTPRSNSSGVSGVLGPSNITCASGRRKAIRPSKVWLSNVMLVRATISAWGMTSAAALAGKSPARGSSSSTHRVLTRARSQSDEGEMAHQGHRLVCAALGQQLRRVDVLPGAGRMGQQGVDGSHAHGNLAGTSERANWHSASGS